MPIDLTTPPVPASPVQWRCRGEFVEWLASAGGSLAVTTYNSGKLAILAAGAHGLSLATWKFVRPMGLAFDGRRLVLAVREHLLEFRVEPSHDTDAACFVLEKGSPTGRVDAHDVVLDDRGPLFAATRFNCLARPSERVNFKRVWLPPFMPEMVARDCCHLNGVGLRDGKPRLATAFCEASTPKAWKGADRFHSGVALALPSGEVVARELNMPHSPRRHGDAWWLCNSGLGALVRLDAKTGRYDEAAAVAGFTRGLTFVGDAAVVGRSRIRKKHILDAPPVRERFGSLRAGLSVIDVASGREIGAIDFLAGGREVYDVTFLPNVRSVTFTANAG